MGFKWKIEEVAIVEGREYNEVDMDAEVKHRLRHGENRENA